MLPVRPVIRPPSSTLARWPLVPAQRPAYTRHFLINSAIYRALRRAYGGQAKYEPQDYIGYSDHRPDITLLLDGALKAFDVKIFDPIGSRLQDTGERGAACGNTHEAAVDVVLGRRERPGELVERSAGQPKRYAATGSSESDPA